MKIALLLGAQESPQNTTRVAPNPLLARPIKSNTRVLATFVGTRARRVCRAVK